MLSITKHALIAALLAALPAAMALAAPSDAKFHAAARHGIPNRYIVVLDNEAPAPGLEKRAALRQVEEVRQELEGIYAIETRETWAHAIQGFSITATEEVAKHLARDPRVLSVEQDVQVSLDEALSAAPYCATQCLATYDPQYTAALPVNSRAFPSSPQAITCSNPDPGSLATCIDNWGIDRIDQNLLPRDLSYVFTNTGGSPGPTVHVYVIDTGIWSQHREIAGRIGNGVNVITPAGNLDDCSCHHHGTAVASVIGGRTYGVAKGVVLHPVKVIDLCNGSVALPSISDYVTAFNWIAQNHDPSMGPAVANLSGANTAAHTSSTAFVNAIKGLTQDGVTFVQSAGNQGDDACTYSTGPSPYDPTAGAPDAIIAGGITELHVDGPLRNGRWVADFTDPLYGGTAYSYGQCVNRQSGTPPTYCGSNYGACVTLWAPAQFMIAAGRDGSANTGSYCMITGTSLAAPHVAGAAALYLQNHPTATPAQVKAALVNGAMPGVLQTSGTHSIKTGSPNLLLQIVP